MIRAISPRSEKDLHRHFASIAQPSPTQRPHSVRDGSHNSQKLKSCHCLHSASAGWTAGRRVFIIVRCHVQRLRVGRIYLSRSVHVITSYFFHFAVLPSLKYCVVETQHDSRKAAPVAKLRSANIRDTCCIAEWIRQGVVDSGRGSLAARSAALEILAKQQIRQICATTSDFSCRRSVSHKNDGVKKRRSSRFPAISLECLTNLLRARPKLPRPMLRRFRGDRATEAAASTAAHRPSCSAAKVASTTRLTKDAALGAEKRVADLLVAHESRREGRSR